jgi:uncharacterized protein YecE (DUF72 family)
MRIYIGTSGFQYPHWNQGVFYPPKTKDRLVYALTKMNVVEINSTFYRIPTPEIVASWAARIPDGSKMVLKAPQSVSHRRRLKLHSDPGVRQGVDLLHYFIDGYVQIPEMKRGPALLQLPNRMEIDLQRLEPVLQIFSERSLKVALEVRHASWFDPCTFDLLARYNAAMVSSDWIEFAAPLVKTADFCYIRRHGPTSMYDSLYEEAAIRADISLALNQDVDEAYILFNNDVHGYAPRNAMEMIELLASKKLDITGRGGYGAARPAGHKDRSETFFNINEEKDKLSGSR